MTTFADIQNGIERRRVSTAHSAQVAALQKELDLTKRLLELSEQLRIRLQLEVDQLRAASPRYTGMHPAMAAPYGKNPDA